MSVAVKFRDSISIRMYTNKLIVLFNLPASHTRDVDAVGCCHCCEGYKPTNQGREFLQSGNYNDQTAEYQIFPPY